MATRFQRLLNQAGKVSRVWMRRKTYEDAKFGGHAAAGRSVVGGHEGVGRLDHHHVLVLELQKWYFSLARLLGKKRSFLCSK